MIGLKGKRQWEGEEMKTVAMSCRIMGWISGLSCKILATPVTLPRWGTWRLNMQPEGRYSVLRFESQITPLACWKLPSRRHAQKLFLKFAPFGFSCHVKRVRHVLALLNLYTENRMCKTWLMYGMPLRRGRTKRCSRLIFPVSHLC